MARVYNLSKNAVARSIIGETTTDLVLVIDLATNSDRKIISSSRQSYDT